MKKTLLIICFLFVSGSALAYSPGTTGFQFLRTQVGARAAGLGGAFVAVSNDIHAIHYNPAGIANIEQRTASITYLDDLLDFTSGFIGFVQPGVAGGNLGVSILYKNYGDFTKTDINGEELGSFGAGSIAFNATLSRKLMENLCVGVTGKYMRSTIDSYAANAVAWDFGLMYFIPKQQMTIAAALNNFGTAVSAFVDNKADLPTSFRVGVSKRLAHLPLLLNVNAYKYIDESLQTTLGGEFTLSERVLLRLGYDVIGRKMHVDSSDDTFAGASIGLGLLFSSFNLDYAFSSSGALGNLNRFTLTGHF